MLCPGCVKRRTQRDDGPKEVRNHHAPLTPRSTQSTGLFKRVSDTTTDPT